MRVLLIAWLVGFPLLAAAQPWGICDVDGGTEAACLASVQSAGDGGVFADGRGRTAQQLKFGTYLGGAYYNGGNDVEGPYPAGNPACAAVKPATAEAAANALDCYGVVPLRFVVPPDDGGANFTAVVDGDPAHYDARYGVKFDLGGLSNKVVVFPLTDHGPLPCESFEYSVYLSNNKDATDQVAIGGRVDTNKWNEALLVQSFSDGWIPNTDGDGYTMVYALPCGVTFRYVSLISGNHGNPDFRCTYHSFDAEVDAVAGLNEDGSGICPDLDHDGHTDIACGGDDCNDGDQTVHPGAPEACDAMKDLNCDGTVGGCPAGEMCAEHICVGPCGAGEFPCLAGMACVNGFCIPSACGGGPPCPPGKVCYQGACTDPCAGVFCLDGFACIDGKCIDTCSALTCPQHQICVSGQCVPSCNCAGCTGGKVCNPASGRCVEAACADLMCPAGLSCSAGQCSDPCAGNSCPLGYLCSMGACTVDKCFGHDCGQMTCDPATGDCLAAVEDAGVPDLGPDAPDLSATPVHDGGTRPVGRDTASCRCDVGGRAPAPARGLLMVLAIALLGRRLFGRRSRPCRLQTIAQPRAATVGNSRSRSADPVNRGSSAVEISEPRPHS